MEGFIINIIATSGFSMVFIAVFFLIYYMYLKGNGEDVRDKEDKRGDKDKRLRKRLRERVLK